jgi:1-acyl-sn-glycerol-3-phosphate acyltransferase
MAILKKNIFGQHLFVKKAIVRVFGSLSYPRFNWVNSTVVSGGEILKDLPDQKVLFVSNHQTYFSDVALFLHIFHAALQGKANTTAHPGYLWSKKHNIYYVAAEETMKSGLLPKILGLSGAVTVNRSWRSNGENVRRKVDKKEVQNIDLALKDGWVITFPQGTTKPFVKGRLGTAIMIKKHQPIVVPIVIDGLRRAFDKKGMITKKKNTTISVRIKPPLNINYDGKVEDILTQIMDGIEQSPSYNYLGRIKEQKKEKE